MRPLLKNKKVLITAGPTREYIDPVRYISNDSSGRMGYALAEAAFRMGARVVLISGPTGLKPPEGVKLIPVVSAREMYKKATTEGKGADIIMCAAAVSDFRPGRKQNGKIKKADLRPKTQDTGPQMLNIELVENPDILKSLGKTKKRGQLLVGFALETENLKKNALKKMKDKNCDMIVGNLNGVIGAKNTSITIFKKDGKTLSIKNKSKIVAANIIIRKALTAFRS